MEDNELIDRFFERDEEVLKDTEKQYGKYCRTLAFRILGNDMDSEEIFNEVLLKAWNAIPPLRPLRFRLYLAKLTRNLAFSKYRSEKALKRGGSEVTVALDELAECIPSGSTPEEHMHLSILKDSISAFVRTLPDTDRKLFVRRYFETESIKEIASASGMSENNVKVKLHRIREVLKKHLEKEGMLS